MKTHLSLPGSVLVRFYRWLHQRGSTSPLSESHDFVDEVKSPHLTFKKQVK